MNSNLHLELSGPKFSFKDGRLGHSAAAVTMGIYAHAFDRGQQTAADEMQAILGGKKEPRTAAAGGTTHQA